MTNRTVIGDIAMLSRPPNLVASEIDGEMVVLNIDSGNFFQLNQIGSRIWEALATPMTMGDLCSTMQNRFDVDMATCRRDVTEFLTSLSEHGLVATDGNATQ